MTELAQALLAIGIVGTFGAAAGLISIKVAERIVEEAEKMEEEQEDYVYMNDGTPVLYNEEDQE